MAPAGAGGQRQNPVIHLGGDAGFDDGPGKAVVDEGLLFPIIPESQAVGIPLRADLIGGEDLIGMAAGVVRDVHAGVGAPPALLFIIFQRGEHGAVVHPVAVDDGVEIAEVPAVLALQEDGAHHAGPLFPGVV